MIYLKEGNIPLNLCTDDDISQQENNTYQLTFKYPVSDEKWILLKNEVHLLADDLSGEQEFVIIDVQKEHGYITVYANQVATLLNGYSIRKINVDRANGFTVMNKLVEGLKRECPFTFFSDISELHTLNIENVSVIDALLKGQHSIIGQWGGDLVRDKYSVRLLKNGGIENQSLFMYKKNLSEYKESTTTKSLKTRIHFRKVITASGEGEKDKILEATVDSPLVDKYKHIYEYDMEVQDQDVKTVEDLKEYGKKYFQSSLCDLPDESLEIEVLGHADQPVNIFDTASIFYELYNVDIRKKITSYNYSPMSKKLKKIGFGKISRSLGGAIGKIIDDVVKEKIANHDAEYEAKVQKLVDNANAEYEKRAKEIENKVTDGIEEAKAKAEVVKEEISAQVTEKIAAANQANKNEIVEEFKAQYNGIEVKMEGLKTTTDKLIEKDVEVKEQIDKFKQSTESQFSELKGAQSRFEQTTEKAISDLTNVTTGKADRSYVEQTVNGIKEEFTSLKVGSRNYAEDYDFTRGLWFFAHGDASDSTGTAENGVYTITGNTNTWKQAQLFSSTAPSWATSKTTALDYLEKGEPYTLSFYAKRNSGSGTMWASLRENRKSGDNPERIYAQFQLTDEWKLYKVSVPALEKSDEFDFWRIIIGYSEAGSISFKKVEVTQSTTRTDAGPAPEDQEAIITNASASFERTAKGLKTQITALEQYTGESGILESRLKRYTEEQTSNTLKTIRENLSENYISKNKYTEDSEGITRRIEALGSQIDQENLVKLADSLTEYTAPNNGTTRIASVENGTFKMKVSGSPASAYTWAGPTFPLYINKMSQGEYYSLGFEYQVRSDVECDKGIAVTLKRHSNNKQVFGKAFADKTTAKNTWLKAEFTFLATDFEFDSSGSFPFYFYAVNNAHFWIRKPILVKGPKLPPYKPNSLDIINSRIESKLAEYKQTVDGQFSTFSTEFGNNLRYATEGINNKLATQEQALTTKIEEQAQSTDAKLSAQADETNKKLSSQNSVLNDKLDDFKDNINGRFANYQQTVNGQIATIVSQFDGVLKKTDINITDGQISFGTGKSINGRTISSLLVQEPEAIALIAQLIKVKGDMVVDGSILGRHIASESVETGHMKAGSVTTQILASNAVTADKLQVDYALIQKLLANQAFIRELISQKAFITELNSIKIAAERVQGGRLSANNGSTVFDLDNGTLNLFSNTGTIRRIDDTSSSQFIKFNQVGLIGEYLRDNKAARIVIGTNQDKTENTENGTFAGMRLWSGAKNDVKESLYELVGDRIIFYANGQYRSPWIIHNNTKDGNSYLIPMNEKGVKHNLGRGDKHFSKAYIDDLFIGKGSQNVGGYLWDILTCFGIIARYGWDLKNGAVQNHIKSNLINKYGFK
ncbi:phage tail spike protein [Streptococcus parasanguinis]|uniref:phage tail spike protein n=1 Tax=Streptococcus parasanguinis TaxID=1318 RepID=UPI0031B62AB5